MKKILSTQNLFVGLVVLVILTTRFLFIDRFPPGMQHDEIEYVLSSKTYQMFGTDLSGVSFPESLISTRTHGSISPIPPLLFSPLWNILPLNLLTVRMAYTLLNVMTAIVFGLLVHSLFKNRILANIATLLFLLNPWSLYLSRQTIDATFALFFYLLGMYILIGQHKWSIPLSFLSFIFGFFSYNGAKLLLVPLVGICLAYVYITQKQTKKNSVALISYLFLAITLVVGFLIASKMSPESVYSSRSSEIVFLNQDILSNTVNELRKTVIQTPFTSIFINKITVAIYLFFQQYLGAFSPQILFSTGEVYRFHGYFYLPEALLLCVGLIRLFLTKKRVFFFITALLLIAPIITASSLNGQSILNRSFLLLPTLLIPISYGLIEVFRYLRFYVPKSLLLISAIGIYAVLFSNILFIYFFQLPIHEHGFYQVATRVLARYVSMESPHTKKMFIVSKEPRQLYLETVFYSHPELQEKLLQKKLTFQDHKTYSIGNIDFIDSCPTNINPEYIYVISSDYVDCFPRIASTYLILDQVDAGTTFRAVGGVACHGVPLTRWRREHLISDYTIESLSVQKFCERWIAQPDP
ncbi:hypothetical protein KBD81_01250 [Candidatus Woesebacteria bacterium]|nr:hypothetical protein [Candidatus Woesebacteria bacterium]